MRNARITVAALAVLALSACGTATADGQKKDSTKPADLTGHAFAIDSVEGKSFHEKLMKGSKLTVEFDDDKIKVATDCNVHGGSVDTSDGVIKVDNLSGTLKACEGAAMEQERWAVEFLKSEPEWQLTGGELTIAADGSTVKLTETGR